MEGDSTTKLLRDVQKGSQQLLRSCTKLGESLPAAPAGQLGAVEGHAEWPRLLGHLKTVATQLGELGSRADLQQLEHAVAVPMHPAHHEGQPSMIVPELLRTKRPPEQEAADQAIRELVTPFLPESNLPREEQEAVASERFGQMKSSVDLYNRDVDKAIQAFLDSPLRAQVRRKSAETVTRFSAKRPTAPRAVAVDMYSLLHQGQSKNALAELRVTQDA